MKKVKRKSLRLLAWILTFAMLMSQVSYAGSWIHQDNVWYYQEEGAHRTGWMEDKGHWYYMDASGAMQTGWHQENGNDWYYLNTASEGVEGMMRTGWFLQNGTWYFLNTVHDGFYGRALTNGWYWIDGYCYLFDANGRMYADCTTPDGYEVNADGQWTVDGVAQFVSGKGIITKEKTVVKKVWDWIAGDDDDDDDELSGGGSGNNRPEEEPESSAPETEPSEEPTEPSEEPTEPSEESTEPSEEPTSPSEESTSPSEESTSPSEESTEPSEESTSPSEESTSPSEESTSPSEEPTSPSEESTSPSEEPTEPSEESTSPSEESTSPSEESTSPSEEPTEPSEESTSPSEEPTEPSTDTPTTPGGDPETPGDTDEPSDPTPPEQIELPDTLELEAGEYYKLDPGIALEGIIWKSNNTAVAKVSALGTVLALSAGTVEITAELDTEEGTVIDTCVVTVTDDELTLSDEELILELDDSAQITLSGTEQIPDWVSSNPEIVSVVSTDEDGKSVMIQAENVGTATIRADVENRSISCVVKVHAVGLEEDTDTTVTRGEWIAELLEAAGYNWYVLDVEEMEWHYSDTKADEDYGLAVEFAYISGFLPEDEEGTPIIDESGASEGTGQWTKPTFSLYEPITREFAAVTGVRALQYHTNGEAPECIDREKLKYGAEAGVAVRQAMLFLNDEMEFRPEEPLTKPEKEQFLTTVGNIKLSETRLAGLKPGEVVEENVVYTPDTINAVDVLENLENFSYEVLEQTADGSYLKICLYDTDGLEIHAGNNLILPPNEKYPRGLSVYVEASEDQEHAGILITGYMQTDIYELVQKLKFEGSATPAFDRAYIEDSDLPEGITVEYDPDGLIDIPSPSTYGIDYGDMILEGTIKYKFDDFEITDHLKLNGSVSFEIPNITLKTDADFGFLDGLEMNQFIFSITEKMHVDAGFTAEFSSERYPRVPGSVELKRFPFALGPTGFFVDFVISFYYSAEGEVKFVYTIQATEGLAYENNDFRYIGEFWQDLQPIALQAKAEAGLKPALNLSYLIIPDIVGVANEIGAVIDGTATTHELQGVSCLDGNIYLSSKIMLNDETIVGGLLKELLDLELEHQYWNEKTSPLKINAHYENGTKVEECTVYSGDGDLSIWVTHGSSYGPLEGAMVAIMSGNKMAAAAFTDADGHFTFKNVRAGIYDVVISASGYESCKYRFRIKSGENYFYPVYLEERAVGAPEYGYNITLDGWVIDDVTNLTLKNVSYKVYIEDYETNYIPLYEGKCDGEFAITLPDNHFYRLVFEANGYETKTVYMVNSNMHYSVIRMTAE